MMWFKRKAPPVESHDLAKSDYEMAVRWVHKPTDLTIALARMDYTLRYNMKWHGEPQKSPDDFEAYGVVHGLGTLERQITCDVRFHDDHPDDDEIGWCFMTHTGKKDKRSEERPAKLAVGICDPEHVWRRHVFDALRDAAISGNRFIHIYISKDESDPDRALERMRTDGYSDRMGIKHMTMEPMILLPNAPGWAWQRE